MVKNLPMMVEWFMVVCFSNIGYFNEFFRCIGKSKNLKKSRLLLVEKVSLKQY